jgi:hypothetical protein
MTEYDKYAISSLIGKTITSIDGMVAGSDVVGFTCSDGSVFQMYHDQYCCESVDLNDVEGDVTDLIGSPVVVAEEVNSDDVPPPDNECVESYTWRFYRLATAKGFVVLRWLGESNGWYSEGVDFEQTVMPEDHAM